ncbi:hypothetical protein Tco_0560912 [Tanacetum coccineum]
MCYPRFTKAIIHHFLTKDKSISMRNRMFMDTAQDDSILGTLRFVSKDEDYQVYGALIPAVMTTPTIRDNPANQTYLAFVTGAATPKPKRIYKKHDSPMIKTTTTSPEETLVKKKYAPSKRVVSSKKPATKRQSGGVRIQDTFGGSSEAADSESEVPDEPKGKTIDTSEGTGLKPRVPDLYGDVNISLKDVEPADKEKDNEEMTIVGHVNVNQEGAGNQVKDDAQATQKNEAPIPSSSISSDYAAKFLNFDNIPPVDTEVVSMLDTNVQHEVPRTSPLLTILVSVIPEHTVVIPPEIVTTASSTTISALLSLLFPHLQQLTPIPTPTPTEATTLTTAVSDSEILSAFHQRITDLEKNVKELKTVDHS